MWIVSQRGFYNIVCQDGDEEKGLLTIKARCRNDLLAVQQLITTREIEESNTADYRFRVKARAHRVASYVAMMVDNIDYPKTKPKLATYHSQRSGIYFSVWEDLYQIQELKDEA